MWNAGRKNDHEDCGGRPENYITTEDFRPREIEEEPVEGSLHATPL